MSDADLSLAFAVISMAGAIMALCCVMMCVKLYTEFVKEKKYREP